MSLFDLLLAPFAAAEAAGALGDFLCYPIRNLLGMAVFAGTIAGAIAISSLGGWFWSTIAVIEVVGVSYLFVWLIFRGVDTEATNARKRRDAI